MLAGVRKEHHIPYKITERSDIAFNNEGNLNAVFRQKQAQPRAEEANLRQDEFYCLTGDVNSQPRLELEVVLQMGLLRNTCR